MRVKSLFTLPLLFFFTFSVFSQNQITPDLHQLMKNGGIQVYNREASLIDEKDYPGIRLSKNYGEGVAWITSVEFSNGTIEFDVRGENVKQHSFVGIAFHGKNDSTFEAVYLRPFQFLEKDEVLRNRAIQYVSLPDFPWRTLREKYPSKFEHAIEPAPDPNSWVHVRIVIKDLTVTTFINGNTEPSLVVQRVAETKSGAIGFYVADTSGGDFANIAITKSE